LSPPSPPRNGFKPALARAFFSKLRPKLCACPEEAPFFDGQLEFIFSSKWIVSAVRLCEHDTDKLMKGIPMHTATVLEHLKKHGQLLDSEIAAATNLSLDEVRISLTELSARGDISKCSITSYVKGKPIEGFQCRLSGFVPRPAPGRKPGVK
jgi:hypothetical protein